MSICKGITAVVCVGVLGSLFAFGECPEKCRVPGSVNPGEIGDGNEYEPLLHFQALRTNQPPSGNWTNLTPVTYHKFLILNEPICEENGLSQEGAWVDYTVPEDLGAFQHDYFCILQETA